MKENGTIEITIKGGRRTGKTLISRLIFKLLESNCPSKVELKEEKDSRNVKDFWNLWNSINTNFPLAEKIIIKTKEK